MRGLLTKAFYEVWLTTLLFGTALMAVEAFLTYILPQFQDGFGELFEQVPFIKSMLKAMLGTEIGDQISAHAMQTFLWVHPTVLALVWGHEITLCTRMPAGEIDRGTIDVLLGLPVSRRTVYVYETIVWLATGLLIVGMGFAGHRLAAPVMPPEMRPELGLAALVLANLYCVYVAIGGMALLVSALCDSRGRAVGIAFSIVLASFLLNFVAQFWEPAQKIAFVGVMEYYQPAEILQSGELPLRDVAVLLSVGAVAWLLGGEVMARRNICTV